VIRHYVELEILNKVPFLFQKHKAILLEVYQVKYTTAKIPFLELLAVPTMSVRRVGMPQ